MSVKEQQPELLRHQLPVQVSELLWQLTASSVGFEPVLMLDTLCLPTAPGS